jgi:hypothetical protein
MQYMYVSNMMSVCGFIACVYENTISACEYIIWVCEYRTLVCDKRCVCELCESGQTHRFSVGTNDVLYKLDHSAEESWRLEILSGCHLIASTNEITTV